MADVVTGLTDEDLRTLPVTATDAPLEDTDGTDGQDADAADSQDADSTDGSDADAADGADADGTDAS